MILADALITADSKLTADSTFATDGLIERHPDYIVIAPERPYRVVA